MRHFMTGTVLGCTLLAPMGGAQESEKSKLEPSPASVSTTLRLGQRADAPDLRYEVELKTADDTESVGWSAVADADWVQLGSSKGGTPATLRVSVNLAQLAFGENVARITLTERQDPARKVTVPITVVVAGRLDIAPRGSVDLVATSDAERSDEYTLRLTSPVKDGLPWRVSTENEWLKLAPTQGVTPSTVRVWGDTSLVRKIAAGELVFEADHVWERPRSRVACSLEVVQRGAIDQQVVGKLGRCQEAVNELLEIREHMRRDSFPNRRWHRPAAVAHRERAIQELVMKHRAAKTRFEQATAEVGGFLDSKPPAIVADLRSRTMAKIASWEQQAEEVGDAIGRLAQSAEPAQASVNASDAEWRTVFTVAVDDVVLLEAAGACTLGAFTANVTPTGVPGTSLDRYSLDARFRHGALIGRIGNSAPFFVGDGAGYTCAAPGPFQVRCNDRSVDNNSGAWTLRALKVALPAADRSAYLRAGEPATDPPIVGVEQDGLQRLIVASTGPCREAGFNVGDRILAVDGCEVATLDDVILLLNWLRSGLQVRVTGVTGGERVERAVTLQRRP